jgi:hypothetical protein
LSQLIQAAEARIAVVFNELSNGQIEVDFVPGRVDVAAVALSSGGGGDPRVRLYTARPMIDAQARFRMQKASKGGRSPVTGRYGRDGIILNIDKLEVGLLTMWWRGFGAC